MVQMIKIQSPTRVKRERLSGQDSKRKKDSLTVSEPGNIVDKELKVDMEDKSSRSRMQTVFFRFVSLIRGNGLNCVHTNNPQGCGETCFQSNQAT